MATLTLIPSGAGLLSESTFSALATRWQCAAYAGSTATNNVRVSVFDDVITSHDLYALPTRTFVSETITSARISANQTLNGTAHVYVGFNDGIGTYWTSLLDSGVMTTNPRTGLAWTTGQINALQIGVLLFADDTSDSGGASAYANTLTITITYSSGIDTTKFFAIL